MSEPRLTPVQREILAYVAQRGGVVADEDTRRKAARVVGTSLTGLTRSLWLLVERGYIDGSFMEFTVDGRTRRRYVSHVTTKGRGALRSREAGHHRPLTAATLAALLLIVVVFWTFPLAFLSVLGRVPLELLCALPVVFFLVAIAFALCVSAGRSDDMMRQALERDTRAETDER